MATEENKIYGSKNRRELYENLSKDGFDLGTFDDFDRNMNDDNVRKSIHKAAINAGWDLPDFDQFDRDMAVRRMKIGGQSQEVDHATYDDFIKRHPSGSNRTPAAPQPKPKPQQAPASVAPITAPSPTTPVDEAPDDPVLGTPWGTQGSATGQSKAYKPFAPGQVRETGDPGTPNYGIPYRPYTQMSAAARDELYRQNDYTVKQLQKMHDDRIKEQARRNQPIVDTGSPETNNNIIKTQGQWEDELQQGASQISHSIVAPAVDKAITEFDKKADEIWGKYNEQSKYVDAASPMSIMIGRQANEAKDPEKILSFLQQQMEDLYKDSSFVEKVGQEADKMGIDRKEYIDKVIKPQIESDLATKLTDTLVKRELPKSTTEYILNGLGNSIAGMLYNAITESKGQREIKNQAAAMTEEGQNPYYNPGTGAKLAQMGVSFAADAPFFGIYGRVSGQVAKQVAEREIQKLIGKGLSDGAARSIVGSALENSVGARMKNYIMQHVISGSLTMGGYNLTSESARQMRDSEFDPMRLAGSTAEGLGVGAAFGITGGASQALSQPLRGFSKIGAKVAGFGTEAETMYATEELSKMIQGEEGFTNPFEGSVEALEKLGVMKLSGGHLLKSAGEKLIRAKEVGAKQTAGETLAELLGPAKTGMKFTEDEQDYIRNSQEGKDLVESLANMHPDRAIAEVNGKKKFTKEGEQMRHQLAENYDRFMSNPDIPADVKQKVSQMFGGIYRPGLETGATITQNEDGSVILKTRDKDGNCVRDLKFDNLTEAEQWRDQFKSQMSRNDAVNMFNNATPEVQQNIVNIVKDEISGKTVINEMKSKAGSMKQNRLKRQLEKINQTAEQYEGREMTDEEARNYIQTVIKDGDDAVFNEMYDLIRENTHPTDELNTKRNYWEGQQLSTVERHKAQVDLQLAEERLRLQGDAFADEVIAAADYPDEKMAELAMRASKGDITGDQLKAALDYYNKTSKVRGMMDEALKSVDNQVEAANAYVRRNTHTDSGTLIEGSYKGRNYYVTAGHFQVAPDGKLVPTDNSGLVILRDKETGEIITASPNEILVNGIQDPNRIIEFNESMEGLRGQLLKEADDSIDLHPDTPTEAANGDIYMGADGNMYMAMQIQDEAGNPVWSKVPIDENNEITGNPIPFDMDEYRKAKSDKIDSTEIPPEEAAAIVEGQSEKLAQEAENAEIEGKYAQNQPENIQSTGGEASTENGAGANNPPVTLPRIPVDEKGKQLFEQAKPEDTLAELTEKYGKDRASQMVDQMIVNASKKLEELTQKDMSGITDMNDIAAHEDEISEIQHKLDYWNGVKQIIDNERETKTGQVVDIQNPSGEAGRDGKVGQGEIQAQDTEAKAGADTQQQNAEGPEANTGVPPVSDTNVSGGAPEIDVKGRKQVKRGLEKLAENYEKGYLIGCLNEINTIMKNVKAGEKGAITPEEKAYVNRILKEAKKAGYEVIDLEGKEYNEGSKQNADFQNDPTLPLGTRVISNVRKPLILKNGEIVQSADVVVKQNLGQNDIEALQVAKMYRQKDLDGLKRANQNDVIKTRISELESEIAKIDEDIKQLEKQSAQQKVAQAVVKNNVGKRYEFKNQDGTRSEFVIDNFKGDDMVTVTRQDFDANGNPKVEPYSQDLKYVDVGNSIVNGYLKPSLSTDEKLRQDYNYHNRKSGGVPIIDVLTDNEKQQLFDALRKGDTDKAGYLEGEFINQHREDIILRGREIRNEKVDKAMSRGSKAERLRAVRDQYKGFDEALSMLEDGTMEPQSIEEYVANALGDVPKPGNGLLAYESYEKGGNKIVGLKDESGFGKRGFAGDTKGFNPWLAPKGKGISLKQLAEQIHESLPEGMKEQFSDQDIRNIIQNIMTGAEKPTDIANYILKNRLEQAEAAARREEENMIDNAPAFQKVYNNNTFANRLQLANESVNQDPTEGQKKAGNYKKGHISFGGYDFTIENPAGSIRRGTDADGKKWEQKMNNTYGYILGKRGKDGDHLDMFINDKADLDNWNGNVYVVDQIKPDGSFDEHKILYGFDSENEAREAYLSNYEKGWQGLGKITGVEKEIFDKWLDASDYKIKDFADYSIVKHKVEQQMRNFDSALKQLNTRGISIDNQELLDKYGLKNVVLSKTGDHLTLTHFIVDQQGQGNRTRFMEDLARLADEKGWTLALTPGMGFGAKSKKMLEDFYKRFGFVANKGRNADFQTRESMIRRPKEFMEKPENQEKVIRDAVVEHLKSIGINVSSDWKEGQRILDEHNRRFEANEESEDQIKSQKVTDQQELDELNKGKTVKRYRAMQLIDGKLYPPMSAKVDGQMRQPTEIGVWEKSEERPDLIKNGKFVLNKGQKGQGNVPAAYNPYFHTSTSGLNDQFTSAYKRPELVVVEVEIPESELTSGYKAEGAKDAVGNVDWHSGVVNGQLPADRQRQVTLSRYNKVNRIVPDSEVADMIVKQLEGTNVEVPYNVVTPALRAELEKRGVKISDKPAGSVTEDINGKPIKEHRVYHGSGSDFVAFDHSHMGEGAGSQSFGYGTYVTNSKNIGKDYAKLTSKGWTYKGKPRSEFKFTIGAPINNESIRDILSMLNHGASLEEAKEAARNFIQSAINDYEEAKGELTKNDLKDLEVYKSELNLVNSLKPEDFQKPNRNLYDVEIPGEDEAYYIDYKGKMGDQDDILDMVDNELYAKGWKRQEVNSMVKFTKGDKQIILNPNQSGADLYAELEEALGSDKAASQFLNDVGVTGIKYPAGTIFGGGEGATNYVIFNENDAQITNKTKFFRTKDGQAYGYTKDGKIYLDPRIATSETPIHEYDHLWCEMKRQTAPEEWNEIKQVMLNDEVVKPIIDRVKRDYEELTKEGREDDFIEEVITQFSGKRGAERLREVAEEVAKEKGGIFGKAEAVTAMQRLKNILNRFWEGVAKMMGWKYRNANQIADRMMSDMLNGMEERDEARRNATMDAVQGRDDIMFQMMGKKGAEEADKAEGGDERKRNLAIAEDSEKAGVDAKAIKLATGWERGADGQWRYEIPDADVDILAKFNDKFAEMKADGVKSPEPILKLSELLGEDNELFKYYPKMKNIQVLFSKGLPDDTSGAYDNGTVELNIKEVNRFDGDDLNNENVYGTLLHEIQHAIQDIEGFAQGGNLYTSTTDEGIKAIIEKKNREAWWLKQKLDANRSILNNPDDLEAAAELEQKSVKEVKDRLLETINSQAAEYDTINLQIARLKHTKSPSKSDAMDLYLRLAGEVEARNVESRMALNDIGKRQTLASVTEDVPRDEQVIINGNSGPSASFAGSKEEFDKILEQAVKEKGIVTPGLADAKVTVIDVPKHDFISNKPIEEATEWAKKNLVTTKDDVNGGNLPKMKDGTPYTISKNAVDKYLSESAVEKSENLDIHLSVLKKLKDVIGDSIDTEVRPDHPKNEDGKRDPEKYNRNALIHILYGAVNIDGKTYRVKTVMQEFRGNETSKPHSYEVTKIELLDSPMAASESPSVNVGQPKTDTKESTNNSITGANLLKDVEKSKDSGKFLLKESKKSAIQGLENYSEKDITDLVGQHFADLVGDTGVEIVGMKVIGSRTKGKANNGSDLDVLLEYKGNMSEDGLFDILNDADNRLYIEGIPVDINPITRGKGGSINQWLKRNADYDKESENNSIKFQKVDGDFHSDNFKNFFGDWEKDPEKASKVVDENGKPLVVYHGTPHTFNTFDKNKGDEMNELGPGMYFTNGKDYAESFTRANGDNIPYVDRMIDNYLDEHPEATFEEAEKYVKENGFNDARNMPVYLNMRKPFIIEGKDIPENLNELIQDGYDGIIDKGFYQRYKDTIPELKEGDVQYVVFKPNQVKSATDNVGTYNPENPDIRYQRVGSPEAEMTPEERQYWNQWDKAMKKWKEKNAIPETQTEAPEKPRFQPGENALDYAKKLVQWNREKSLWQTAPKIEDYRKVREDKDVLEAARENERRYPDSPSAKMRRAAAEFQRIRSAMNRQKAYDKATVKAVTDFAQEFMKLGFGDNLSRGEIERMLSSVKNATGAKDIKKQVDNIMNILIDNHLRNLDQRVQKLSSVKELSKTAQGVEKQGRLELKGQRMIQAFRDAREKCMTVDQIRERMAEVSEKMNRNDEEAPMWEQEYEGLSIALQYAENIEGSRQEWGELDQLYKDAVKEYKTSGRSYKAQQEYLESLDQAMQENKIERIGLFGDIIGRLEGNISESMQGAKEFVEREKQRVKHIQVIANYDLAGKDMGAMRDKVKGKPANFFLQPLGTFEQMLKQFGSRNANGEGYLYDYFMRNWMDATDKAFTNEQKAKEELDAKAREVFGGKVKRWSDLYDISRSLPTMDVEVLDGEEPKTFKLTQGNLLYIYMADKMVDGRMKLRKMGIDEDAVEKIKDFMDPRLVQLGDWLQGEYLPQKRTEYNKVHERMFGAPMAAIDNYFPLKVLGDARYQEQDVNVPDSETLPSTITGNIIKRRKNALPLDILHTDALSLAIEHVEDMERWAAQAEWNKDINTLLSYTTFRNKVKNMNTIYGSGDALWNSFKDAAKMAAGTYNPSAKSGHADAAISNIAKGVTAAKINFRVYTAFKQLLSAPAFLHDVNLADFVHDAANPYGSWKWAMENMPVFQKRWKSRQAGDTRLMDDPTDWKLWKTNTVQMATRLGMSPNALVDGVTCAVGARSIYKSRYKKYKEIGASDEVAHKRALQDAEIGYNLTQQSSEGAFVSAIQKDRTVAANMLSVFRNSSMAYTRQWVDAARNLKKRSQKGYKEDSIKFMARQMQDQFGLDETQAKRAAELEYAREGRRDVARLLNMMFGVTVAWNLGASLPYLLIGDDDNTKKEMLTDALMKGLLAGPTEGLAAGNIFSDFIGRTLANEQTRNTFKEEGIGAALDNALKQGGDYEVNPLPLMADLQGMIKKMGYDKYAAAQDVFNIVMQSAVGVNPQTFTDMWNAIMDYTAPGWDGTSYTWKPENMANSKELALFMMRLMNAPTSSWRNKYIDELGMNAKDAQKLPYEEMARRYAHYKHWKDVPIMGWFRGEEARNEKIGKIQKQFDDAVSERMGRLTDDELMHNVARSESAEEKRRYAKMIAQRLGLEPGEDSRKADEKKKWYQNLYQQKMLYEDIKEDEMLAEKIKGLYDAYNKKHEEAAYKSAIDEKEFYKSSKEWKERLDKAKKLVKERTDWIRDGKYDSETGRKGKHKNPEDDPKLLYPGKRDLIVGDDEGNEAIMRNIRQWRKEALEILMRAESDK